MRSERPVPMLIRGLVENLPADRKWTRREMENWLAVAEKVFDVLYDFDEDAAA